MAKAIKTGIDGRLRIQRTSAGSRSRRRTQTEIAARPRPRPNHQPRPSGEKKSQMLMSSWGTRLWITNEIADRTPTATNSGTSQFRPRQRFASPCHRKYEQRQHRVEEDLEREAPSRRDARS